MIEAIGLIELELSDLELADRAALGGDDTLDGLFARLIRQPQTDDCDLFCNHSEPSRLLTANLDALSVDLHAATREILAEIFLALGRR